jgi:hypothetical protein
MGCDCRNAPSDREKSGSGASTVASSQNQGALATVERCGVDFLGQISVPAGEIIQEATKQTKACPGDECLGKAMGMISPTFHRGPTCAEVRKKLNAKPIVDAWGAQARVTCNGYLVQALSAGRDGKIGTCDDLSRLISLKGNRH